MSDIPPTRRTDEPPSQDGAPLAGWPVAITAEEAVALQTALGQLQTALDAVVRERDEARGEVERSDAALTAVSGDLERARKERDEAREELWRLRVKFAALRAAQCEYPDCVDLAADGTCHKWVSGRCRQMAARDAQEGGQ